MRLIFSSLLLEYLFFTACRGTKIQFLLQLNHSNCDQTHCELGFALGHHHHVFGDVLHDGLQVGLVVGGVVLLCWRLKRVGLKQQPQTERCGTQVSEGLPTEGPQAAAATSTEKRRRSPMDDSEPFGSPGGSVPSDTWPACVSLHQTDKQLLIFWKSSDTATVSLSPPSINTQYPALGINWTNTSCRVEDSTPAAAT